MEARYRHIHHKINVVIAHVKTHGDIITDAARADDLAMWQASA
jgi:hypothetical protein